MIKRDSADVPMQVYTRNEHLKVSQKLKWNVGHLEDGMLTFGAGCNLGGDPE